MTYKLPRAHTHCQLGKCLPDRLMLSGRVLPIVREKGEENAFAPQLLPLGGLVKRSWLHSQHGPLTRQVDWPPGWTYCPYSPILPCVH